MAAKRSVHDSELACDAGTLKRIGAENNISYGRALLAVAELLVCCGLVGCTFGGAVEGTHNQLYEDADKDKTVAEIVIEENDAAKKAQLETEKAAIEQEIEKLKVMQEQEKQALQELMGRTGAAKAGDAENAGNRSGRSGSNITYR